MKTFQNDSFHVEATEEKGCRLALNIKVHPKSTQKAYKKALKTVNKKISIPGFRKGRAPDATVISRHGAYVEQEWKDIVLNDAYRAALELTGTYPLNKEAIKQPKIESCSQEEGAIVTLSYEHYPRIPEIDFSTITLPHFEKEPVTDERIEEIVEEVKRSNADWEDIIERNTVEKGDFIDASIDSLDEDPPKSIVEDRRFEMVEGRVAPWMMRLIIGMKVKESVEGLSEVDEKADEETKAKFTPTNVRITVHSIKKMLLPELTEELAKKVGADSIEDMKAKIRSNLEKDADEQVRQKQIGALETALIEKYVFDLPSTIVESNRASRLQSHLEDLKKQGTSDEEIQQKQQEIETHIAKDAERALRLYFLNKQIAKQGNISLSDKNINDELLRMVNQNPYLYGQQVDKELSKNIISRMATQLIDQKTQDYALKQVLSHASA